MSEHMKLYYETDRRGAIRNWMLNEMVRGAGWAAGVLVGIGLFLYAIYLVGLLLPEASKTAPPPMPFSQVQPLHPAQG